LVVVRGWWQTGVECGRLWQVSWWMLTYR
jgi:hypothetical protein